MYVCVQYYFYPRIPATANNTQNYYKFIFLRGTKIFSNSERNCTQNFVRTFYVRKISAGLTF